MPFDALQPDTAVPDLTKPTPEALAYVLRHKELWPADFGPWMFASCEHCAIGLANKLWFRHSKWWLTSGDLVDILGLPLNAWTLFIKPNGDHTPEGIADRLERHKM